MSEIEQYDYHLPPELIAQHPLPERSDARLMLVDRAAQSLEHLRVRDLPEVLQPGDCLVLNETQVIAARLLGTRQRTGGAWEGLFLAVDAQGVWQILAKTRGKPEPGEVISLYDSEGRAQVELVLLARLSGGMWAARPQANEPALAVLARVGHVPLPHYIRGGAMTPSDRVRYQTVFASQPGSVAAPTAGLHFTAALLHRLEQRGIATVKVVLHVGMGTFRPISAERLDDHVMHQEWGRLSEGAAAQLAACRARRGRCVAVGTTSVRVLETAAQGGSLTPWEGATDLFIRPPYRFRAVDALLTNFHLPRSTLLVLVRCFGGDRLLRRAYSEAIAQGYRFFSYGDAMLIV